VAVRVINKRSLTSVPLLPLPQIPLHGVNRGEVITEYVTAEAGLRELRAIEK